MKFLSVAIAFSVLRVAVSADEQNVSYAQERLSGQSLDHGNLSPVLPLSIDPHSNAVLYLAAGPKIVLNRYDESWSRLVAQTPIGNGSHAAVVEGRSVVVSICGGPPGLVMLDYAGRTLRKSSSFPDGYPTGLAVSDDGSSVAVQVIRQGEAGTIRTCVARFDSEWSAFAETLDAAYPSYIDGTEDLLVAVKSPGESDDQWRVGGFSKGSDTAKWIDHKTVDLFQPTNLISGDDREICGFRIVEPDRRSIICVNRVTGVERVISREGGDLFVPRPVRGERVVYLDVERKGPAPNVDPCPLADLVISNWNGEEHGRWKDAISPSLGAFVVSRDRRMIFWAGIADRPTCSRVIRILELVN